MPPARRCRQLDTGTLLLNQLLDDSESREFRQGQRVAVRIEEPGDLVTPRGGPDPPIVLFHPVVAPERHTRRSEGVDHGTDVVYFPTGDGERLRSESGHLGEADDGPFVPKDDGEG